MKFKCIPNYSWSGCQCVGSVAALLLIGGMLPHSVSAAEPTNAAGLAKIKSGSAYDIAADSKRLAALLPEALAWEKILETNLGSFYLPLYKADKLAGRPTAWDYVADQPGLPRVLLLGDSISRGYTLNVRAALAGKANIHRAPENCGPAANALKKLPLWLGDGKWDLIHFNFGIHDRETPIADYEQRLETIVARLQATGARLICASSTPLPEESPYGPNAAIIQRNEAAARVMARLGIPVDDLYQLILPRLADLQNTNDVHFKNEGYAVLGKQVASSITASLSKTNSNWPLAPVKWGKNWGFEKAKIFAPKLPRVLLIGDSICIGYRPVVTQILAGKANVDVWLNPMHQASPELHEILAQVLAQGPYAVIHFNMGLHGWIKGRIPDGQFAPLTRKLVTHLREDSPGAKLIWASTTPITLKGRPTKLDATNNAVILSHNQMAAEVMAGMKVPVDDLYGLMTKHLALGKGDTAHWQAAGYQVLGQQVAAVIEEHLKAKPD